MTVSTPGGTPEGWVITIAHLVYLPAEAVDLAHAGDDAKEVVFDVDFKVPVFARWRTFASDFALTTTRLFKSRSWI